MMTLFLLPEPGQWVEVDVSKINWHKESDISEDEIYCVTDIYYEDSINGKVPLKVTSSEFDCFGIIDIEFVKKVHEPNTKLSEKNTYRLNDLGIDHITDGNGLEIELSERERELIPFSENPLNCDYTSFILCPEKDAFNYVCVLSNGQYDIKELLLN